MKPLFQKVLFHPARRNRSHPFPAAAVNAFSQLDPVFVSTFNNMVTEVVKKYDFLFSYQVTGFLQLSLVAPLSRPGFFLSSGLSLLDSTSWTPSRREDDLFDSHPEDRMERDGTKEPREIIILPENKIAFRAALASKPFCQV